MRNEILKLREEGKTYNQIVKILGCSKGTVSYHCGTGQKAKAKSRAYLNRDKNREYKREKREKLSEFVYRYKRLCGCSKCKENDPVALQFDHIGEGIKSKVTHVSQMVSDRYSLKTIKDEIRKCQILCANCHAKKTAKDLGYYKNYII